MNTANSSDRHIDQLFAQLRDTEPDVNDTALTDSIISSIVTQQRCQSKKLKFIYSALLTLLLIFIAVLFPWSVLLSLQTITINTYSVISVFAALSSLAYYCWLSVEGA